jgi:PhzF family phenazine biosynthesis protein
MGAPVPFFQVDAFTSEPFSGNPAAVCLLTEPATDVWMQLVAREMNLAETAFVLARPDGDFDLRWFTPATEVDLCGHATLAAAFVLWDRGVLSAGDPAAFHTRSGVLTATRAGEWIDLDFPSTPPDPIDAPAGLIAALGVEPLFVGRSAFDYLVVVGDEDTVRGLHPDLRTLASIDTRGVIVTSRAQTPDIDFVSRFFAPAAGIDEDPVTGSAHCCLAPYWSARLGKRDFVARQLSFRGGELRVSYQGDRTLLRGQAVMTMRGEIVV